MERQAIGWGAASGMLAGGETALLTLWRSEEGILVAMLLLILAAFVALAYLRTEWFLPAHADAKVPQILGRRTGLGRF